MNEWLRAISASVRPTTLDHYEQNIRVHVLPTIGSLRLQDVSAARLNRLYAELLKSGRCHGGGLSPKTVRHVHTTLHKAINFAVRWGLLMRNPTDQADPANAELGTAGTRRERRETVPHVHRPPRPAPMQQSPGSLS